MACSLANWNEGAVGIVADKEGALDERQQVLLHIVEMMRQVRAKEGDQRRGGKAAHTDGLGSHQIQRIAKPEDTAAFGEQIVERRRQEFLLDRSEEHTSEIQSLKRTSNAVLG